MQRFNERKPGVEMGKRISIEPGQTIEVLNYPFVRTVFHGFDNDGPYVDDSWRPGCDADTDDDGRYFQADALGAMLLEVVQVVKLPGGFAPRVFYARRWRDPDGKVFGKRRCRVTTTSAFAKLMKGYRHDFYLDGELVWPAAGILPNQPPKGEG